MLYLLLYFVSFPQQPGGYALVAHLALRKVSVGEVGEENKTHTRRERICCEKRCANTTLVMSKPMPGLRRMQYIFYGHDQWIWPAEEGRMSTRASALCPRIRNPGLIPTGPEPHNSSTAYAKLPSRTSDMGQRRVSSRAKRPHAAALTLGSKK